MSMITRDTLGWLLNRKLVAVVAFVVTVLLSLAQTQPSREELTIKGYSGQAAVVRSQGRVLVDVQDLARMTNGSLSFEGNRIVLSLPAQDGSKHGDEVGTGFSRSFMKAAIEAMATMREWGGTLLVVLQNGYPVGNTSGGNAITEFQNRAAESVALASAAASTESDYQGLELLRNEFKSAQAWSDSSVKARASFTATSLSTSPNGLNDDDEAQKILRCGQFLAQMFASGSFQDNDACH